LQADKCTGGGYGSSEVLSSLGAWIGNWNWTGYGTPPETRECVCRREALGGHARQSPCEARSSKTGVLTSVCDRKRMLDLIANTVTTCMIVCCKSISPSSGRRSTSAWRQSDQDLTAKKLGLDKSDGLAKPTAGFLVANSGNPVAMERVIGSYFLMHDKVQILTLHNNNATVLEIGLDHVLAHLLGDFHCKRRRWPNVKGQGYGAYFCPRGNSLSRSHLVHRSICWSQLMASAWFWILPLSILPVHLGIDRPSKACAFQRNWGFRFGLSG